MDKRLRLPQAIQDNNKMIHETYETIDWETHYCECGTPANNDDTTCEDCR